MQVLTELSLKKENIFSVLIL